MISLIIPAYNEATNIPQVLKRLDRTFDEMALKAKVEIIIVDDHSSDNTFDVVKKLNLPNVNCISLSRRSGSHIALRAGIYQANGDAAICIAADGQDDPKALPNMLAKWKNGAKIVWALRKKRDQEPVLTRLCSNLFYFILRLLTVKSDQGIDLNRADFYLIDRQVIDAVKTCPERNTSLFGLIAWMGFDQDYIEYDRKDRISGHSKWNFKSRIDVAKDWIIAFSGLPLKIMTYIGFSVSLIGLVYAMFVFFNATRGNPIMGWSSLIIVVIVLGGFQISMLGLIGEYLWKTLDESKKRPLFFINKSIAAPSNSIKGKSRSSKPSKVYKKPSKLVYPVDS